VSRNEGGTLVLNKTLIYDDESCYIYRRGGTTSKYWQFYYWNAEGKEKFRIRTTLKTKDFLSAQSIAQKRYIDIKGKIRNEESLQILTVKEMTEIFLRLKKENINPIPHSGGTPETFRILSNRCKKLNEFLGENTKVDQLKRNAFEDYQQWRENGFGGKKPQNRTTITTELSTFKRILLTIAVKKLRILSNLPDIPEIIVPPDEKTIRRNDFRQDELSILLKAIKEWKEEITIRSSEGIHRKMIACAIEMLLNSGMRIGAFRKIRWRDIRINTKDDIKQQKIYRIITVPAKNNKTGKQYECNCDIAIVSNILRALSAYTDPDDLLFCNQNNGKPFSIRIWSDAWDEIIRRSGLEENTGRHFSYYSLRHTYATTASTNKVPILLVANNMDTSVEYIQKHYYHHRAEDLTNELNPIRKKKILTGREIYDLYKSN